MPIVQYMPYVCTSDSGYENFTYPLSESVLELLSVIDDGDEFYKCAHFDCLVAC